MNPATRVRCNPMPYFTPEQVAELVQAHQSVSVMSIDLQSDLVTRKYRTAEAREHGIHGLSRRIATLARCVDAVFDLLPPGESGVPETRAIDDATIYIQAFIFNVFGCCDNIAWLWVLEQHVLDKKGSPIDHKRVGIGPEYHQFRASCSPEFRTYLESRRTWFDNLKNFRDALAHRIHSTSLPIQSLLISMRRIYAWMRRKARPSSNETLSYMIKLKGVNIC